MDDHQLDEWFSDKLKSEQEFDFRESDWDAVAEGLDQKKKDRRRAFWWWWPAGVAALMIIGLLTWQQREIGILKAELEDLKEENLASDIAESNTNSKIIQIDQDKIEDNNISTGGSAAKPNATDPVLEKVVIQNNQIIEQKAPKNKDRFPHNVSNSSVIEDQTQLSAVDSKTESLVFSPEEDKLNEKIKDASFILSTKDRKDLSEIQQQDPRINWGELMPLPLLQNSLASEREIEFGEISYDNEPTTKKIKPKSKWKPLFATDLSLGYGKPQNSKVDLDGVQGNFNSQYIGLGVSMQTVKHLWLRFGVSRQQYTFKSNSSSVAADYFNAVDIELDDQSAGSGNGNRNNSVNAIKDRQIEWQYELGLRYDWLRKKSWTAYTHSNLIGSFTANRKVNYELADPNSAFLMPSSLSAKAEINREKRLIYNIQFGAGASYNLTNKLRVSLEGNVFHNTEAIRATSILSPLWDVRTGLRYQF